MLHLKASSDLLHLPETKPHLLVGDNLLRIRPADRIHGSAGTLPPPLTAGFSLFGKKISRNFQNVLSSFIFPKLLSTSSSNVQFWNSMIFQVVPGRVKPGVQPVIPRCTSRGDSESLCWRVMELAKRLTQRLYVSGTFWETWQS